MSHQIAAPHDHSLIHDHDVMELMTLIPVRMPPDLTDDTDAAAENLMKMMAMTMIRMMMRMRMMRWHVNVLL